MLKKITWDEDPVLAKNRIRGSVPLAKGDFQILKLILDHLCKTSSASPRAPDPDPDPETKKKALKLSKTFIQKTFKNLSLFEIQSPHP